MPYDKRKVVCLTVALPLSDHERLTRFCEQRGAKERRLVSRAEVARVALAMYLAAERNASGTACGSGRRSVNSRA